MTWKATITTTGHDLLEVNIKILLSIISILFFATAASADYCSDTKKSDGSENSACFYAYDLVGKGAVGLIVDASGVIAFSGETASSDASEWLSAETRKELASLSKALPKLVIVFTQDAAFAEYLGRNYDVRTFVSESTAKELIALSDTVTGLFGAGLPLISINTEPIPAPKGLAGLNTEPIPAPKGLAGLNTEPMP